MGPCVCSCQFIQNKDTKVLDTSINEQCNKIQKFSNRAKEESNESQSLNNSLCIRGRGKNVKPILSHLRKKNIKKCIIKNYCKLTEFL